MDKSEQRAWHVHEDFYTNYMQWRCVLASCRVSHFNYESSTIKWALITKCIAISSALIMI